MQETGIECPNPALETEYDDAQALAADFRMVLFRRVDRWLEEKWSDDARERIKTIRDNIAGVSAELDAVEAQLQQALLLSRTADSKNFRDRVGQRLGDVEFWRGQAELEMAIARLKAASERFEKAVGQRPQKTSDSDTWRDYTERIADELAAGPTALRFESPDTAPAVQQSAGTNDQPRVPGPNIEDPEPPTDSRPPDDESTDDPEPATLSPSSPTQVSPSRDSTPAAGPLI